MNRLPLFWMYTICPVIIESTDATDYFACSAYRRLIQMAQVYSDIGDSLEYIYFIVTKE